MLDGTRSRQAGRWFRSVFIEQEGLMRLPVSRLRRTLLGACALALCAFASASIALGSPGRALACADSLLLGTTNSCDGQTSLSGSTDTSLLALANSSSGTAATALSATGSSAVA